MAATTRRAKRMLIFTTPGPRRVDQASYVQQVCRTVRMDCDDVKVQQVDPANLTSNAYITAFLAKAQWCTGYSLTRFEDADGGKGVVAAELQETVVETSARGRSWGLIAAGAATALLGVWIGWFIGYIGDPPGPTAGVGAFLAGILGGSLGIVAFVFGSATLLVRHGHFDSVGEAMEEGFRGIGYGIAVGGLVGIPTSLILGRLVALPIGLSLGAIAGGVTAGWVLRDAVALLNTLRGR